MILLLNFFASPLGRWLFGLSVLILVTSSAYVKGRLDCASLHNSATLRGQVIDLKKQLDDTSKLLEAAKMRERQAYDFTNKLSDAIDDYEKILQEKPAHPSCSLNGVDADRLRQLAPRYRNYPATQPLDIRPSRTATEGGEG